MINIKAGGFYFFYDLVSQIYSRFSTSKVLPSIISVSEKYEYVAPTIKAIVTNIVIITRLIKIFLFIFLVFVLKPLLVAPKIMGQPNRF